MSSVQSSFAQISPRGKYLLAVTSGADRYTAKAGEVVESVMTESEFVIATNIESMGTASGELYTDMGKTVNVVNDTNGLVVQKYVKARIVNGADSEGNDGSGQVYYLYVWSASPGQTVALARTG